VQTVCEPDGPRRSSLHKARTANYAVRPTRNPGPRSLCATSNGLFGDGVVLIAEGEVGSTATFDKTEILKSARAGIALFASSVSLSSSRIACSQVDLAVVPSFVDKTAARSRRRGH